MVPCRVVQVPGGGGCRLIPIRVMPCWVPGGAGCRVHGAEWCRVVPWCRVAPGDLLPLLLLLLPLLLLPLWDSQPSLL